MARPLITLLTDFGLRDPSAAICHGVIRSIAPDADVLDISHEVRKFAVRDAALLLWCALPYLEVGIHVAVVDPGVGTERRPIAIEAGRGDVLIGPDNGLLPFAADRVGGPRRVVVLEATEYQLPIVSTSFHGRDIFAPAAAHLATGVPLERLGAALEPADLVRLPIAPVTVEPGRLTASVIYVDTFGNVKLTALASELRTALGNVPHGTPLEVSIGIGSEQRTERMPWVATFGSVSSGEPLVYEDSYGRLCIAVNTGDAARSLGLAEDMLVALARA